MSVGNAEAQPALRCLSSSQVGAQAPAVRGGGPSISQAHSHPISWGHWAWGCRSLGCPWVGLGPEVHPGQGVSPGGQWGRGHSCDRTPRCLGGGHHSGPAPRPSTSTRPSHPLQGRSCHHHPTLQVPEPRCREVHRQARVPW